MKIISKKRLVKTVYINKLPVTFEGFQYYFHICWFKIPFRFKQIHINNQGEIPIFDHTINK